VARLRPAHQPVRAALSEPRAEDRDHIAILMENNPRFFEFIWAAQQSALLHAHQHSPDHGEVSTSSTTARPSSSSARRAWRSGPRLLGKMPNVQHRLMINGTYPVRVLRRSREVHARGPRRDEVEGQSMLYSSGTTGRPKASCRPTSGSPWAISTRSSTSSSGSTG